MDTFLRDLMGRQNDLAWRPFAPVARYHPDMDVLIYVKEDCSYRADRVDAFLTVLYHPHTEELVGLKLKGFRFIFKQLQAIIHLAEADWMPLVNALEIALVGGVAQSILDEVEAHRVEAKYRQARDLVRDVQVPPVEWAQAA